jgi:hypothetical protein
MKNATTTPETAASRNLRDARDSIHLALLRIARMQDRATAKEE